MKRKKGKGGGDAPVEKQVGRDDSSFGHWLRCQREGREISLREIADASKISLRYLQAFEEDRFEVLPSSVFAKGFLRQYSRYVGLDPEEVVNFYMAARRSTEEEEAPEEPKRTSSRSSLLIPLVFVLAALLLLGAIAFLSRLSNQREASLQPTIEVPPPIPPPRTPSPPPMEVVEELPLLRVTVDFTGECWVEYKEDGERGISETKVESDSLQLEASESVELTLGNAGVAVVEINGIPYEHGAGAGEKRTLVFDRATVAELTEVAEGG
jgi:cytoskeletal protein RodZ